MEPLNISETDDTPKVHCDESRGVIEITSGSFPENAIRFYAPIINWVTEYVNSPSEITSAIFHYTYISSSSLKQLASIIFLLDQLSKTKKVVITWNYDKHDMEMRQTGERLEDLFSMKFIYNEI